MELVPIPGSTGTLRHDLQEFFRRHIQCLACVQNPADGDHTGGSNIIVEYFHAHPCSEFAQMVDLRSHAGKQGMPIFEQR